MCNRGNNPVLCWSFIGRGDVLEPGSVHGCTTLLERKQREGNESESVRGVLKVDPTEHILVFQMNHQQGVVCIVVVPCEENLFPAQFWANYLHFGQFSKHF